MSLKRKSRRKQYVPNGCGRVPVKQPTKSRSGPCLHLILITFSSHVVLHGLVLSPRLGRKGSLISGHHALLPYSCMSFSKLLNLSGLSFLICETGMIMVLIPKVYVIR